MAEITRIVIKGSSGYCCYDEAFNDKVTITQDSIAYEYVPYQETDINPKRKWSYKTNSPIFKMKYDEVAGMLPGIIERGVEEFCTDIGGIEFNITSVYNFINDRFVDESAVLRPLSWHLILYVFRYFSRKWQKISD